MQVQLQPAESVRCLWWKHTHTYWELGSPSYDVHREFLWKALPDASRMERERGPVQLQQLDSTLEQLRCPAPDRMCTPGFHGSTVLFLVSSRSAVRSVRGSKSEMDSAEKFRNGNIYINGQTRGPKICSHILYVYIYQKT